VLQSSNPAASAVNRAQLSPLLWGDWETAQTIAAIRGLVDQGKKSVWINRQAIAIVWNTPNFSETDKARAIFDWVRQNTRFIPMIRNVQTLRAADEILRVRGGDCANLNAVLIPSLLETIGIPARLVTVAADPDDRGEFTHVYAEAFVDGQWVPMDVARPGAQFGRAPELVYRQKVWNIDSGFSGAKLSGLLRSPGLGQTDLSTDVGAVTSGAANVIAALRASPTNISASSSPFASTQAGIVNAAASGAIAANPTIFGIPVWVVFGALVLGAVALAGSRR
jgi:Transglutaminase-like superfamily